MLSVAIALMTLWFPIVMLVPIIALAYPNTVKINRTKFVLIFFPILIVAYLTLFQLMAVSWGHNFPGLGFRIYLILPYFAVITGISFIIVELHNRKTLLLSNREKISYTIGAMAILGFQFSAKFWFQVVGPILLSEWTVCSWFLQFALPCR